METLRELIIDKGFDKYQSGLGSRFSANRMTYKYQYIANNGLEGIAVNLEKEDIIARIEILENGNLAFEYGVKDGLSKEYFKCCSAEDFHTILAYAFLYLRDGNVEYHKDWHERLTRA